MFIVYDTFTKKPLDDGFGHVKVYGNRTAAKRRAQSLNNAAAPIAGEDRFRRYAICKCKISLDIVWGQPQYEEV